MYSLKGKKEIITGAGSGIGTAIAVLFVKQGAEVYVIDLSRDSAQPTVEEITANGSKIFSHICSVISLQAEIKTFEQISDHTILVINAGFAHIGKAGTTSEEDFDRVVNVNIKGVYNWLYASFLQMKKRVVTLF